MEKTLIGREEWIALPEIGLPAVKVRVDSGAKTSALHAFNIQTFEKSGKPWVRFDIHPIQNNRRILRTCEAPMVDKRMVTSSNGSSEERYVIGTTVKLGEHSWSTEITLTNREAMGYRMLLGRETMRGRLLVDPDLSFCIQEIADSDAKALYEITKPIKSNLRIAVLATNPALYSNQRLMEAGEARGHEMVFLNARSCYMNINTSQPEIHYEGKQIDRVDAVIPRLRPSMTFYGCAVLRQFQSMGAFCMNDAVSINRSRDKLRALQLMANKGIDMPVTGFASSPQNTRDLIKMVGDAPLVVKLLEGTQGMGVVLAETNKAAESVINAFKSLKANILVQEFVKEANSTDLRCFVIDDQVVGGMKRVAAEGEFRANLHLGGRAEAVELTPEERETAIKASQAIGLKVAGVDILRSSSGPKVIEVNSSPGLQGIEEIVGQDLAGEIIESIERHVIGSLEEATQAA